MASLRLFVALSVFASAVLYTQAAPAKDLLGPPRTLEDDTNVNPSEDILPERDNHEGITVIERYNRVNEDGTIEFKLVLSNGRNTYQRIRNKVVDGKTIQVYEGYTSLRYDDGRYGTTYYIADENGYRRTRVEVDTVPPVLPENGPYPPDLSNEESDPKVTSSGRSNESGSKSLANDVLEQSALPTVEEDGGSKADDILSKRQTVNDSGLEKPEKNTDEDLAASTVLPTTEDNTSEAKQSKPSTEVPSLPPTDENVVKSTEELEDTSALPTTEGSGSGSDATEESIIKTSADENIEEESSSTVKNNEDDSTVNESSTSMTKGNEDLEVSELPKTEDHSYNPSEDKILAASTEAPELTNDEISKIDSNTELSAAIEEKELNAITEVPQSTNSGDDALSASKDSQEDVTTPSASEENVTKLASHNAAEEQESPASEVNASQSETNTELPAWYVTPVAKDLRASTEIPSTSEEESSSTFNTNQYFDASTEVPAVSASEENVPKPSEDGSSLDLNVNQAEDKNLEGSTEVPALPTYEENLAKSSEDESGSTLNANQQAEDKNLEASTEVSAHSVSEENLHKASDDETFEDENREASTEVPALPVSEESLLKTSENESSSDLDVTPVAETKNLEVSTEIPQLSDRQDESSSTLNMNQADEDKNLEASTEVSSEDESKTELPTFDLSPAGETKNIQDILSEDSTAVLPNTDDKYLASSTEVNRIAEAKSLDVAPVIPISKVNINKTLEHGGDLLALEDTQESALKTSEEKLSIELSSEENSKEEKDVSKSETSSEEDSDEKDSETVAQVHELPATKNSEEDD